VCVCRAEDGTQVQGRKRVRGIRLGDACEVSALGYVRAGVPAALSTSFSFIHPGRVPPQSPDDRALDRHGPSDRQTGQ
jgi:hypothetical protein